MSARLFCLYLLFRLGGWRFCFVLFRMGHLALIPALVAITVIVMQQRHWFSLVTLLAAHVPVSLGLMDRTAASVLQVTGATALMAARVSQTHICTLQEYGIWNIISWIYWCICVWSVECECRGGRCDPRTGECHCAAGMTGKQCDTCLNKYSVPVLHGADVHCQREYCFTAQYTSFRYK